MDWGRYSAPGRRCRRYLWALGAPLTLLTIIVRLETASDDKHPQVFANLNDSRFDKTGAFDGLFERENFPAMGSKDMEKAEAISERTIRTSQAARNSTLWRVCGRRWGSGPLEKGQSHSLLVDDYLQVIYCVVPKVACTNMKTVLATISQRRWGRDDARRNMSIDVHNATQLAAVGLNYLKTYTAEESQRRLKEYYKFVFVRDPLERILSAYLDKFVKRNKWTRYFHMNYGRFIIRTFRKNPRRESLANGDDVKFSEFVKFIIFQWQRVGRPDDHWMPTVDLCYPCKVKYDFIGKYETLDRDSSFLLKKIQKSNTDIIEFPQSRNNGSATRALRRNYYRTITKREKEALYEIYQADFQLFGYKS